VRINLPGGLPPPPEAATLLEQLRGSREELIDELRFRSRCLDTLSGRQARIEPPIEETPDPDSEKVARLRSAIEKLLKAAEEHILEMTEAEKDSVNNRYIVLSCALRSAEAALADPCVF
jgi:hypothetical protein